MANKKPKVNKGLLITLGVVALGAVLYFLFLGGSATSVAPQDTITVVASGEGTLPGGELIILLQELELMQLDAGLFARDDFRSLTNFSIPLPEEPRGRSNPFAPIGQ